MKNVEDLLSQLSLAQDHTALGEGKRGRGDDEVKPTQRRRTDTSPSDAITPTPGKGIRKQKRPVNEGGATKKQKPAELKPASSGTPISNELDLLHRILIKLDPHQNSKSIETFLKWKEVSSKGKTPIKSLVETFNRKVKITATNKEDKKLKTEIEVGLAMEPPLELETEMVYNENNEMDFLNRATFRVTNRLDIYKLKRVQALPPKVQKVSVSPQVQEKMFKKLRSGDIVIDRIDCDLILVNGAEKTHKKIQITNKELIVPPKSLPEEKKKQCMETIWNSEAIEAEHKNGYLVRRAILYSNSFEYHTLDIQLVPCIVQWVYFRLSNGPVHLEKDMINRCYMKVEYAENLKGTEKARIEFCKNEFDKKKIKDAYLLKATLHFPLTTLTKEGEKTIREEFVYYNVGANYSYQDTKKDGNVETKRIRFKHVPVAVKVDDDWRKMSEIKKLVLIFEKSKEDTKFKEFVQALKREKSNVVLEKHVVVLEPDESSREIKFSERPLSLAEKTRKAAEDAFKIQKK